MSIARQRELLVLSTLNAHPLHGYRLAEVLEGGLGRALGLKRSAIYAILKRLSDRGWIEGQLEREGQYPERLVYHLTADGRGALPGLARDAAGGETAPQAPLVTIIAHLDLLPRADAAALLQRLIAEREEALSGLAAFEGHTGTAGAAFGLLSQHLRAELDTLNALSSDLHPNGTLA